MTLHLAEISTKVAAGRHAAVLVDQAAWHLSGHLVVPDNITILPLPAKCPELNPQENVWQFMRDNWLSNRVFTCYDNLVDHCCDAWNKLIAQPWRIMSLELAHGRMGLTQGINRGRDAHYCAPPAQSRTCGIPAYGSHRGCLTRKR